MRNDLVKLKFEMTCEIPLESADDLGRDIANDLLMEMCNGEDVLEWNYVGYEVIL